ncbi:transposase [Fervidobacterium sp. SC_NGM5_O18]|nr:transposase [Fervidobacterium sp. SC_NGM5_O18]
MPRESDFSNRPRCPYCDHPTKVYINAHYHRRAPDGSLVQVTSFICSECKRTFSFPKAQRKKRFDFPYPRCPHCDRPMKISKVRHSYVRFRCRTCDFKTNVDLFTLSLVEYFSSIRFSPKYPISVCLHAFELFYSNLSIRQIRNVLISQGYSPSVSTIYQWIINLSKAIVFSPILSDIINVDEKFEKIKIGDERRNLYIFFAVSKYRIVNFVVSTNRDTFEALQLIFPCKPKLVYSDGLPSYAVACEKLNIKHKIIDSKKNQPAESRNSLLAMFTQVRRGFKKLSNVFYYIKAFVVMHNIKRELRIKHQAKNWTKIQKPLLNYLFEHHQELFALQ